MRRAPVEGRRTPFALVVGLAAGIVATGLVVPYVRADVEVTSSAAGGPLGAARSGTLGTSDPTAAAAGTDPAAAAAGTAGAAGDPAAQEAAAAAAASSGGTDAGVTDTEVRLGIAILDIGAAKDFGFAFDLGDQKARWDALIKHQNDQGGINGRQIVPDYRTFDAGHPTESQQAACVGWTKDTQVFSVLVESQLTQATAVCLIGEGATPVFTTDGIDDAYYANGLYFSTQASDNRILADHAAYLADKGVLEGKTIGVLAGEGAERLAIDNTLIPSLAARGYQVKTVEMVPGDTSGTQKLSIAVSNFKAAGVDFVIIAANVILAGPFVQSANRSGFNPEYSLSDFNNQINDQVATYYPDEFDGTIGLSTHRFPEYRAGLPVPPADRDCMDRVKAADPKIEPYQNSAHEVGLGECAIFDAWVAAALGAGPDLNRANLVAAADRAGTFGIPSTFDGSFGPGKHSAVDFEREVAWHKDCTCWRIVGDPNQLRRIG